MRDKDLQRLDILERLDRSEITAKQASETLGICIRQLRRLRRKFEAGGPSGILHGNLGRKSHRALPGELRAKVAELYRDKYSNINFALFRDVLAEKEGIDISSSSVRRILRSAGLEPGSDHRRRKS